MRLATAAEVDAVLAATLPALLAPRGFVAPFASPRRWVRARPPLRDVFEVSPLKGAELIPRWGLSLDFVPHVQSDAIRWHRTDKSAVLDVVYDPIDFDTDGGAGLRISMLDPDPLSAMQRRVGVVLPEATSRALAWLETFTAENLLDRFEQHRDEPRPGGRFAFHNHVQQPLALAFVLAGTGRADEANRTLDAWATDHVSEATYEKLRALLAKVGGC